MISLQATPCIRPHTALPVPFARWTTAEGSFAAGAPMSVTTVDVSTLSDVPEDTKPGRAAMVAFKATESGVYGVALNQPGWIDVRAGGWEQEWLESVAHGHGPKCSTIRKIVRFRLENGG